MHAMDPLLDVAGLAGAGGRPSSAGRWRSSPRGPRRVVLLRDTTMKLASGDAASPQTLRQYGLGAQILSSLGLSELVLLTNSPVPKVVGLDAYGLSIVGTRPISLD
jgi:3,4-dihydroxy 2-butanone 4-phosphate synthase / GTP cyclohydrolase II